MIAAGLHIVSQPHSSDPPNKRLCVCDGGMMEGQQGDGLEELSIQRSIEGILS